ncbi:hypothetical protein SEA_KARATE_21 [Microbacterium phage Karate]|nr:hypothetical protein SEA_KARATE_21 [Microbacterium phage Karate]
MASKVGLTWTSDTLTAAFSNAPTKAVQYLARTTEYYSFRSETFAKSKAKWTDRTGNARGSLSGTYEANIGASSARFEITISHGMPYGIWLELRWGAKFAIINKTVDNQGKAFFDTANKVMAKMFGGSS